MLVFVLGMIAFFATHHIRQVVPGVREAGIARFGAQGWKGIYAGLSGLGLILIIVGWIMWRPDAPDVFYPPDWGRHVTYLLVWIGFVLNVASSQPVGYIKRTVKHPMSLGIVAWAGGHLFANGDLASVLLFGVFAISSTWHIAAAVVRGDQVGEFTGVRGDIGSLLIGSVLYAVFAFWLHGLLMGVAPF